MGKITRQELSSGLISELDKSGNLSSLTTTEKGSLVGAINEVDAALDNLSSDAVDITYDNTTSGLTATDVQNAIDELAASGGASTAADITFTNTNSWIDSTNVQAAIDEVANKIVPLGISATGGAVTTETILGKSYKIHIFTSNGNFVVSSNPKNQPIDVFLCGGGGRGGTGLSQNGGIGGGGGYTESFFNIILAAGTYPVTIGAGGNAATTRGGKSIFASFSVPGGYPGDISADKNKSLFGGYGGSGGGSGGFDNAYTHHGLDGGYNGENGQSHLNGTELDFGHGQHRTTTPFNLPLMAGMPSWVTYYGSGGGGSAANRSGALGGNGSLFGGGNGGSYASKPGTSAAANRGGGGGASVEYTYTPGDGGSGIVIIRYLADF